MCLSKCKFKQIGLALEQTYHLYPSEELSVHGKMKEGGWLNTFNQYKQNIVNLGNTEHHFLSTSKKVLTERSGCCRTGYS